ncbi:hypothetical protein [Quisquiliibacterium transsilvanicum]|uniref:Transcriptional regulator NrdR family protein n=1 Tax=Quisquiliibacterium transsilvanicum TaxID=1549638 RepID=A0A7W8M7U1_9BURK|nr:hypothetical protein [Quisquiliibacterium transsilvanicum]MBB5271346.1 transcriptional regulator NrdR family protein [Quisquiliibacterium transsilvanicum]
MSASPACKDHRGAVVETRPWRYGWTMRKPACACGHRYTTYEIPAENVQPQTDDEVDDDGQER